MAQFQVSYTTPDGSKRKLVTPQDHADDARARTLELYPDVTIERVKLIDPQKAGHDHGDD